MAGSHEKEKLSSLKTLSTDRRKLIGQAIIDGLISPAGAAFGGVAFDQDYNQGQGGYTQKGGDHKQQGGDYNQSAALTHLGDLVTNVINPVEILRETGKVTRGGGG